MTQSAHINQQPHETSDNPLEHTTQVEPMTHEGHARPWRLWTVGIGIAVILAVVVYGIGVQHKSVDSTAPQSAQLPSGPSGEPNTAPPTGRGDASVPQKSPGAVTTQGQGGSAQ